MKETLLDLFLHEKARVRIAREGPYQGLCKYALDAEASKAPKMLHLNINP